MGNKPEEAMNEGRETSIIPQCGSLFLFLVIITEQKFSLFCINFNIGFTHKRKKIISKAAWILTVSVCTVNLTGNCKGGRREEELLEKAAICRNLQPWRASYIPRHFIF